MCRRTVLLLALLLVLRRFPPGFVLHLPLFVLGHGVPPRSVLWSGASVGARSLRGAGLVFSVLFRLLVPSSLHTAWGCHYVRVGVGKIYLRGQRGWWGEGKQTTRVELARSRVCCLFVTLVLHDGESSRAIEGNLWRCIAKCARVRQGPEEQGHASQVKAHSSDPETPDSLANQPSHLGRRKQK